MPRGALHVRIAEPLCAGPVMVKDTSPFAGFHLFRRLGEYAMLQGMGMPSLGEVCCTRLPSSSDTMAICDSVLLRFPLN